jgi:hypothetical protein
VDLFWTCGYNTMVEHLPHHPEVKGSSQLYFQLPVEINDKKVKYFNFQKFA